MKLTGKLKKEVDGIDTKEGKRDAIRNAGMLLTDEELDMVSGGGHGHGHPYDVNYGGEHDGGSGGGQNEKPYGVP